MSDDSNAPADLSNNGIDLSQIFRPAWTVETTDSTARLVSKYDEGDRGDRTARHSGRRRDEQGRTPSRDREQRGSRPQSGGHKSPSGQRGERSHQDRVRDRDSRNRPDKDRHTPQESKPILEGWNLTLIPEHAALEAISKQIRSRAKAYPLFELARLVVHLSDRYSIQLKAASAESPELFRVKADGSLWTSRREAVSHLLSKHLEKFYHRASVTIEAPKGAYTVVAQCGMSGVLLGPPNHHEYQSRLIALHASRFKNLPFEVYKSRIKMMRDEALMEQWKTEQSTRTVFTPIDLTSQDATLLEETAASQETLAEEPIVQSEATPEAENTQEQPTGETESSDSEPSVEAPSTSANTDGPQLSLEQATEHFYRHHAEAEVEQAAPEISVPGRIALHESSPLLRELLLKTLQELDRFPLPLAQVIGKELTGNGLQIFKAQKKIIHVSVARPRYLDRATTPTSQGVRAILEYLEAHPKQPRDKQWAGLLALRTESANTEEETLQRREQALGTDLIWLLHQGHAIDFAMGNLQAALRPVAQPQKVSPASAATPPSETPQSATAELENPEGTADTLTAEVIPSDLEPPVIVETPSLEVTQFSASAPESGDTIQSIEAPHSS
jgi:hypothetical protein